MKKLTKYITALLTIIIIPFSLSHGEKNTDTEISEKNSPVIKIASFNMQIFGKTKLGRPNTLTVLAEIAADFDIIALQEVGSNRSSASDKNCTEIMEIYISKINQIAGKNRYTFIRGDQYAIVYRKDMFRIRHYSLYSGDQIFSYKPLIAGFETTTYGSNFDFSIITIHTSPKSAENEILSLKTAINEIKRTYSEPDVLCLGDYNADGSYYDEGAHEWLYGFDPEYYITGIPNSMDTTVADSDNTYDRIQMTADLKTDFTGNSGVFRFGEIYDMSECEGTRTTSGTEKAVSDHYPVWCEFYTDRDTD